MAEKRILVTGAGGAPGANFIASLRLVKDEDFHIVGADINKYHLELTEGVDAKYLLPRTDDPAYFDRLNGIVKKERIDFIHSQPEQEVWAIAHNQSKVQAKTLFPKPETLALTYDKAECNRVLREHQIAVPRAYRLRSEADIQNALDDFLRDQDRVWLRATRGAGATASLPVNTMLQARGWIDYWSRRRGLTLADFMISEFLPGAEFAFQSLWYEGELITSMARKREEYLFGNLFPSGQSSSPSIAVTVHRDDVNKLATSAILAVDPKATGIFCADIKENKDGVPCLMEVNAGRFFTTSINFSTAGLNMPYYYVKLALEGRAALPKLPQYNGIPAGWYWIRLMDMGSKLVKGEKWSSIEL
jgi:carbamoyl-phosphate synthase large subunit